MKKFDLISEIHFNEFFKSNLIKVKTGSVKNIDDSEIEDRLKKIYYIAVKTRNFEISQLVQRNNFMMIFQGVLITCIIYSNNTVAFIHTAICFIGIFISFFQMQISAGAKFWQEYWESEVNNAEQELKKYYVSVKKESFHKLFNKDTWGIRKKIHESYYGNKEFKDKIYSNERVLSYTTLITYNPFTSINKRILTKPSVSKTPIRTARLLLISWIILFISSTYVGDKSFNYFNGHKFFTGFPGKSVTSIDIRNSEKPNRNDGFDDDRVKCAPIKIPFKSEKCE